MVVKFTTLLHIFSLYAVTKCDEDTKETQPFRKFTKFHDISPDIMLIMLDASGKPPSGILKGNHYSLGNFDECYEIVGKTIGDNITFYGKYCLGSGKVRNFDVSTGVCIPSFVSAEQISGNYKFTEDLCYSQDTRPELPTGAIYTIVVISLFLIGAAASTICHLIHRYNGKKLSNEVVLSFSLISNSQKLFSDSSSADQITCLNGIKTLSMMGVVVYHHYILEREIVSNSIYVEQWLHSQKSTLFNSANIAVDSFFIVGGFLNSYTFLNARRKGVKFNLLMFYLNKLVRIMPNFGVAEMTYMYLVLYLGNGPFWNKYASDDKINCEDCCWTDLLFIGNYVKNKFCMTMVWYLAVDMQLFILSPLILLPLSKWHKPSLVVLVIFIILGCVSPIVQGIVSKLHVVEKSHIDPIYFTTYYIKTHTRFGPYVIGILFGYLLLKKTETNIKNLLHPILIMIVWTTCIALLFVCLYAGHDIENYTEYDFWATVWLMGISHPLWSFVVGTIILLCASGLGGPINSFLSLPIFSFLAKLSYAMYLLQFHAMLPRTLSIRHASTFSPVSSMVSFWGDFMVILAMSVVLFLAIEAPVDSVYQQFVRRKKTAPV